LVGGSHTQLKEIWIDPSFKILPPPKKKKKKLWKIPKDYKLQQQMNLRMHSSAAATTHDLKKRC
jgi:hypothetical protein